MSHLDAGMMQKPHIGWGLVGQKEDGAGTYTSNKTPCHSNLMFSRLSGLLSCTPSSGSRLVCFLSKSSNTHSSDDCGLQGSGSGQ